MQWTLVTGGAKRLGASICYELAEAGHAIAIHYRKSEKEAEGVAEKIRKCGGRAETIQGDFSSKEAVLAFASSYKKRFDETCFLVNNVGNYLVQPGSLTPIDSWYDLFETNFFAPLILTDALLPSIINAQGAIVNIGVAGLNKSKADITSTAYTMTKNALFNYTKSLAREMAPKLVRVNMVSPGYIDNAVDLPDDLGTLPMGRAAAPIEIARVVRFLLDKESGYITGQNIEVSGGVGL